MNEREKKWINKFQRFTRKNYTIALDGLVEIGQRLSRIDERHNFKNEKYQNVS